MTHVVHDSDCGVQSMLPGTAPWRDGRDALDVQHHARRDGRAVPSRTLLAQHHTG